MKILLDTHIAIWAIAQSDRLGDDLRRMLASRENVVYYSLVSVWEIAIKHALRPENMPISEERFVELCDCVGFAQRSVSAEHIFAVKGLVRAEGAPRHNDPFDRLLIAQAKVDGMRFVTHDSLLPSYGEPCLILV